MKRYPKYGEPGFDKEFWFSKLNMPKDAEACVRQLAYIYECENAVDPNAENYRFWDTRRPSKHRRRLVRMFHAYKRMEARA